MHGLHLNVGRHNVPWTHLEAASLIVERYHPWYKYVLLIRLSRILGERSISHSRMIGRAPLSFDFARLPLQVAQVSSTQIWIIKSPLSTFRWTRLLWFPNTRGPLHTRDWEPVTITNLHFKHSRWWKRRRQSKFTSHYAWGTNGVCECKMDVKSTWIPTWHQMDHVSWPLGLFSKTTSWR